MSLLDGYPAASLGRAAPYRLEGFYRAFLSAHEGLLAYNVKQKEGFINTKLFVGNMSFDTTQNDLESLFSQAGSIIEVFMPTDRNTGRPRGFAFVKFTEQAEAEEAINRFDGYELGGRNLRVSEAEERPPRSTGFADGGSPDRPYGKRANKPKGSRRNVRARKRGF